MTTNAPDQSDRAYQQITEALRLHLDDHISHATARLIAASISPGPGTALEVLAATGRFDVVQLERELHQNRYTFPREMWRQSLLGYLAWQRTKQPWMRGLTAGQKRRLRAAADPDSEAQLSLFADGEQSPSNRQQPGK